MLNLKESKRRTGLQWQKAIIGELWAQWFILWEMQNKHQHASNKSTRAKAEREEVERSLRDTYDLREQMEPSMQQLLCRDLTNHFAKPLWLNKTWLAVHGPLVVKKSGQRAKQKATIRGRNYGRYNSTLYHGSQGMEWGIGMLDCTCLVQYRPTVLVEWFLSIPRGST